MDRSGIVIDASVFVSAFLASEPDHEPSRRFLLELPEDSRPHISSFSLWETAAALFRRTGDQPATDRAMKLILDLPARPTFHLFDSEPCQSRFPDLLYKTGLRAADLVYVSLARSTRSTLVTLDREMLAKSRGVVRTSTPAAFLQRNA